MFCRHCGKELDSDSVFCRYCGKPVTSSAQLSASAQTSAPAQTSAQAQTSAAELSGALAKIFGGIVFLIIAALMTAYCLLHLTGSGAVLTMLMTIPAAIICVGCWITFAGSRRKKLKGAGFTLIGGGLIAQIVFVGAEGAIFGILSAVNFINFLNDGFIGSLLQNYGSRILVMLVMVGVAFVAYGAVMGWLLSRLRRSVVSAKRAVVRGDVSRWRRVRVPGAIIFSAIVAAGAVIKLLYIYYIYEFFYFMLYPRLAMTDGIFSFLFSDETSGILSGLVGLFTNRNGQEEEQVSRLKDFFLSSLTLNGRGKAALIVLLAVLACVIVLLIQIKKKQPTCDRSGGKK